MEGQREGTNAQRGLELLEQSGLAITTSADLTEAAKKIISAAEGK